MKMWLRRRQSGRGQLCAGNCRDNWVRLAFLAVVDADAVPFSVLVMALTHATDAVCRSDSTTGCPDTLLWWSHGNVADYSLFRRQYVDLVAVIALHPCGRGYRCLEPARRCCVQLRLLIVVASAPCDAATPLSTSLARHRDG